MQDYLKDAQMKLCCCTVQHRTPLPSKEGFWAEQAIKKKKKKKIVIKTI